MHAAVLDGSLLECRANLVIAPSHLTKQWQDEVEANCPSLRVIVITTKPQHEKVASWTSDIWVASSFSAIAQRSQPTPTFNCSVSSRWLCCCRQRSQRKKSLLSSKNRCFVYVCAYEMENLLFIVQLLSTFFCWVQKVIAEKLDATLLSYVIFHFIGFSHVGFFLLMLLFYFVPALGLIWPTGAREWAESILRPHGI